MNKKYAIQQEVERPEKSYRGTYHGPLVRAALRVGRNEPCPCGSGFKFKRCCMIGRYYA